SGDERGELAPFPSIANAAGKTLDFFAEFGDTIYADFPSPDVNKPQALTAQDFLQKHNEEYSTRDGLNTFANLRGSTSVLATIDDHELTDNFAGGATPAALHAFRPAIPEQSRPGVNSVHDPPTCK